MDLQKHRQQAADHSLGASSEAIYQKILQKVREFGRGGRVLDFGAGRGDWMRRLQQENLFSEYSAIDLMARPQELPKAIHWTQADLNESMPFAEQSFDFVTAVEVIEHLENPRHMLREISRVLKAGGRAVLSTPNNESYRSLMSYFFRGHFVAFTDRSYPAHITPLNRQDLRRAATEAGFQLLQYAYTDSGCVPGWTAMTWQRLTLGVAQGLRYSDNVLVVLEKPSASDCE